MTSRQPRTPRAVVTAALLAAAALVHSLGGGLLAPAHADPMRPLTAASAKPAPQVDTPGTSASAPVNAEADPAPTAPTWPPLLALRRDAQGRQQALIGEQWLGVGDRVGEPARGAGAPPAVTVAAIHDNSVQLQQGRKRYTLHLLPPLHFSEAVAPAASTPSADPSPGARAAPVPQRAHQRRQP